MKTTGLNKYRDIPIDEYRGSPLRQWGTTHRHLVGDYWTVPIMVSLEDLKNVRAVVQDKNRSKSVRAALTQGLQLPPIEIGVFKDGSGWLIDGNHRLVEARKLHHRFIEAVLTFVE